MDAREDHAELLVAFLDANIILEGKPVSDLPWHELISTGTIRALIVPKAMEEIDAKKRDGRLGPHARAFNRLIAPSIINGHPIILRESGPRVELEMTTCSRIPWDDYDELDREDGDSRIVAEAIHARNLDPGRRILISHDIKPLAYARGRGLPVFQASDEWLRPIEPGPKDKEIQRLKQQVIDLRKDEPSFEISIKVSDVDPATIYDVSPLDAGEADNLVKAIRARNPRKQQRRDQFSIGLSNNYDSSYDDKYSRYISKAVPDFVAAFHDKFAMQFNQRPVEIRVSNVGQIRADHLVISVRTNDGWINDRIIVVAPDGPLPPVIEYDLFRHNDFMQDMRDIMPVRIGRHEFETIQRPVRSSEMEVSCEDFRSGQEYRFKGVIVPSCDPRPLELTVSLTAANLRGEVSQSFRMEKMIAAVSPGELVNIENLKIEREFPVRQMLERSAELRQFGEIEWDGRRD